MVRIPLVKKALIHYPRVPWASWCGVQECPGMHCLENVYMSELRGHAVDVGKERTDSLL